MRALLLMALLFGGCGASNDKGTPAETKTLPFEDCVYAACVGDEANVKQCEILRDAVKESAGDAPGCDGCKPFATDGPCSLCDNNGKLDGSFAGPVLECDCTENGKCGD